MFQGSFREMSRGFQKHFKGILSKIEGHFKRYKEGLRVFERSLNGVSRGFQENCVLF